MSLCLQQLKAAVDSGADQSEIDGIAKKAAQKARQDILNKAKVQMAIRDVLTNEQKQKLKKLSEHKEKRMAKGFQH